MNVEVIVENKNGIPVYLQSGDWQWGVVGSGEKAAKKLKQLLQYSPQISVRAIITEAGDEVKVLAEKHGGLSIHEKAYEPSDLDGLQMLVVVTGNTILDEKIQSEARERNILVFLPDHPQLSDFILIRRQQLNHDLPLPAQRVLQKGKQAKTSSEQRWMTITSRLIWAFVLMVIGHIIISYLPLPGWEEIFTGMKPYFNYQFLFFVLSGFLAQMVDGVLSMGYGVTSATCLMTFGVNPVAMSAAIHTSEIFTTGISGYSHYRFGNVNKKLFKHLVIPGVIGAILGALMLVLIGEKYGRFLMPLIAVYAGFLGLKILAKAFQKSTPSKRVKRIGWLAGAGGFLDSFGGGGWGPIVTSNLIAKGRSPKYTVGSVSLTEFFVTMSSAFTFFVTVGVSHWNIVLGLLIGGGIAAPIAARLAGKLPRKTMMIAVGIMVMVWCIRMLIKSF